MSDVNHWERATEHFAGSDVTLFGDGASPDDIRQGSLGNCWFLSAASALAEVPGRMEKVFLNSWEKQLNPNGIYAVNFYTLGVPHTVVIDDYLPLHPDGSGTLFAGVGFDKSLWVSILEKAFAKYHGNYAHIVGGDSRKAVRTLYGAPHGKAEHNETDKEKLW